MLDGSAARDVSSVTLVVVADDSFDASDKEVEAEVPVSEGNVVGRVVLAELVSVEKIDIEVAVDDVDTVLAGSKYKAISTQPAGALMPSLRALLPQI